MIFRLQIQNKNDGQKLVNNRENTCPGINSIKLEGGVVFYFAAEASGAAVGGTEPVVRVLISNISAAAAPSITGRVGWSGGSCAFKQTDRQTNNMRTYR